MKTFLLGCVIAGGVAAQTLPVLPVPGGQPNSAGAGLALAATQSNGVIVFGPQSVLAPTGSTATLGVVTPSGMPILLPWTVNLTGSVLGAPGVPIALAVSVVPGSFGCGGFGNLPCASTPYVPQSVATPAGVYHLTDSANPPIVLLDGIGVGLNPAPPASLDGAGTLGVSGSYQVGGVPAAPNSPAHVAVQALVADPTSPAGLRLTAALVAAHWEAYP